MQGLPGSTKVTKKWNLDGCCLHGTGRKSRLKHLFRRLAQMPGVSTALVPVPI